MWYKTWHDILHKVMPDVMPQNENDKLVSKSILQTIST